MCKENIEHILNVSESDTVMGKRQHCCKIYSYSVKSGGNTLRMVAKLWNYHADGNTCTVFTVVMVVNLFTAVINCLLSWPGLQTMLSRHTN